jgi:putative hemolysin
MQTAEMADSRGGFYSEQEFDLGMLPPSVIASSVEIGRACIAREHRNGRVLHLLWRGLATYLVWNPHCRCDPDGPEVNPPPRVPTLFQSYLDLGAMVLGPPAIDRQFKTIDWLVLLDTGRIDPDTRRAYFR